MGVVWVCLMISKWGLHYFQLHCMQFSSLERQIVEYNSTAANKLALLISELEKLMSKFADLQSVTDAHTRQLTSLEAEVAAAVVSLTELKKETQKRIEALEEVAGRAVGEEEVVRIFGEELSKQVESKDGLLWSWLATVGDNCTVLCAVLSSVPMSGWGVVEASVFSSVLWRFEFCA